MNTDKQELGKVQASLKLVAVERDKFKQQSTALAAQVAALQGQVTSLSEQNARLKAENAAIRSKYDAELKAEQAQALVVEAEHMEKAAKAKRTQAAALTGAA